MGLGLKIKIGTSAKLDAAADELRRKVFIDEQGVPEEEIFDGLSVQAVHVVIFHGEVPVATTRMLQCGESWRIGLVAVERSRRGQHLGDSVMKASIEYITSHGGREIVLTAQQQASGFYEKLGFEQCGEAEVFESGFVLVPMKYKPRLVLHVPNADELEYRRYLIADEDTMSYNDGYGDNGGCTYHHTPEQAIKWWNYWNSGGNYYAYVVRVSDGVPVGEVEIHFPEGYPKENGVGWIGVIIEGKHRRKGYGEEALKLLVNHAFNTLHLKKLLDDIPPARSFAIRIFERVGFKRDANGEMMEICNEDS